MNRRFFLTKSGVVALGAFACSNGTPLSPDGKANIKGTIVDNEGKGVPGANITLTGAGLVKSAVSDSKGVFYFNVPQNTVYEIKPDKAGYKFNPPVQKISLTDSKSCVVNIAAILSVSANGRIEKRELGRTGIKLSKFGFGSHVSGANTAVDKREKIMREALDRGITVFDVYDIESGNQYGPMGKHLAPVINDVVISISLDPPKGYTVEQEIDRACGLFGRSYIDMVRCHLWSPTRSDFGLKWSMWEELFALRDKGKIRAVGLSVHAAGEGVNTKGGEMPNDIEMVMKDYPDDLNYVLFPFNFYHNIGWPPELYPEGFIPLAQSLREKGIGILTMKPFAGDAYIATLKQASTNLNPDLSFTQAALRYVLNSGLEPDSTFCGMNQFGELIENVEAYYKPEITTDENNLLDQVKTVAGKVADKVLPDHYKFLKDWAPKNNLDLDKTI